MLEKELEKEREKEVGILVSTVSVEAEITCACCRKTEKVDLSTVVFRTGTFNKRLPPEFWRAYPEGGKNAVLVCSLLCHQRIRASYIFRSCATAIRKIMDTHQNTTIVPDNAKERRAIKTACLTTYKAANLFDRLADESLLFGDKVEKAAGSKKRKVVRK